MAILRSTIARSAGAGVSAYNDPISGGGVSLLVSDSSVVKSGGEGLSIVGNANVLASVTESTLADNFLQDLWNGSVGGTLWSSGTNTLTGRGAGDTGGTITPNPRK